MTLATSATLQVELTDADRDDLTKIANRRYFERRLADRMADDEVISRVVLLLDLDRFKAVNDSLGHAAGDALLCRVADRIASQLTHEDTFARLGGDEFGIILHAPSDVTDLATRIIELVQRTYLIEGSQVNIGISIGIACSPQHATDPRALTRCADLALYQAKSTGRNCFVTFEPPMAARAKAKRQMEIDLRKAVALRQLEVLYCPQIDVATQQLVGLQAVLRWNHPRHGALDAAAFVPLAEETGVILPIGEWMLKTVCKEAGRWPGNISVALRVSPFQFESNRFLESVQQALATYNLTGSKLEFEVTESILLHDTHKVTFMLERLRAVGIRVAVDSFGTGVASLSQMVDFPLDKIKIARSLVNEESTGMKERAIVRAIASLGASLGISTVIEGITTHAHLSRIQVDGCPSLQGCLLSEPVPATQLAGLVDQFVFRAEHHTSEAKNER